MKKNEKKDGWDSDGVMEDLPLLVGNAFGEDTEFPPQKRKRGWIIALCVAFFTGITAVGLVLAFSNSTTKALQDPEPQPPIAEESEEWRGAFAARNIYEECYQSVVTVRLGRDDESACWSGFVIDEDGWIVTSIDMLDDSRRGKIYVSFHDGREYSVDSIWRDIDRGIALMKTSACSLNAVELRQEDMQNGERVICVGALEYGSICVSSGEICGTLDGSFKINIGIDESGIGAPLFDNNGCLVAMVDGAKSNDKISYAISAEMCKSIVEYIKNEKSQQNH